MKLRPELLLLGLGGAAIVLVARRPQAPSTEVPVSPPAPADRFAGVGGGAGVVPTGDPSLPAIVAPPPVPQPAPPPVNHRGPGRCLACEDRCLRAGRPADCYKQGARAAPPRHPAPPRVSPIGAGR